jgi:cobalt-zinc-cadmium efflux system outer membrane protein
MVVRSGIAALAVLASFFCAAPSVAGEPIDFVTAARQALAAHPETRRWAAEFDAARARLDSAGLRPPLEVGADLENVGGTGDVRGTRAAEFTVSLGSLLERGDKRGARVAVASAALDALDAEQRTAVLDRIAETGRRFVALGVAQERTRLAREVVDQADTTAALIRPRVEAARSPRTELLYVEIVQSEARAALDAAERELVAAQAALAAQWAAPDERPVVRFAPFDVPEPAPWPRLRAALETLPDLQRLAAERRVAAARVALAEAQQTADWRWQVGARRLQELRDQALVAGISVPIGQRRRAEPEIRERRAELTRVEASESAVRLTLETDLYVGLERLRTLRTRLAAITDEQLPKARVARELTERGYRIGRFPYRELAVATRQVLDLELARLDVASDYHLTRIELERLTGAQLALVDSE